MNFGNQINEKDTQFSAITDQISSILDDFYISQVDLKTIKGIFESVCTAGNEVDTNNRESINYFNRVWENFLENIDEYFKIPAEKRLEHYIKSTCSEGYSILSEVEYNSEEIRSDVRKIKNSLKGIANNYESNTNTIKRKLSKLQNTIEQMESWGDNENIKENEKYKISLMFEATEQFEHKERNVKEKQKKIHDYTKDFNSVFAPNKKKPVKAVEKPKIIEETPKIAKEEQIIEDEQKKEEENKAEKEKERLRKELEDSYEEEKRLNTTIDNIKGEIAEIKRMSTSCNIKKKDLEIITSRNNVKIKKQDIQQEIQELKAKEMQLENNLNKKSTKVIDEEQQSLLSTEENIRNEYLKNRLRFADQYDLQIYEENKEFSTIIKALKNVSRKNKSNTVTFSNSKIEAGIVEQQKINKKVISNVELLIQQNELQEPEDLIDVQCVSLIEEIGNVKNEIEMEQKRVAALTKENIALREKKDIEIEDANEELRNIEEEIKKWEKRSQKLEEYFVEESVDPVPKSELISRSEFDPVQNVLEQRTRLKNIYNILKRKNGNLEKLKTMKEQFYQVSDKLSDMCHFKVYDNLVRKQTELKSLQDSYQKVLNECIERRQKFINVLTTTGDMETEICLEQNELSKKGIAVDIDNEKLALISNLLFEKLNKAAEIKRVYDWFDEKFDSPSVKNEKSIEKKYENAIKMLESSQSVDASSGV